MNAGPSWVFLVWKKANKNCWLDMLSQSFSDIFHNYFTWQKLSNSIVKFAPDDNEYLRNTYSHSDNTRYSQTIAQTLKALDLLLMQSLHGIIVVYTQKHPWGASIHRMDIFFSCEGIFSINCFCLFSWDCKAMQTRPNANYHPMMLIGRGLLILYHVLNERVAKGVTSDPHDFKARGAPRFNMTCRVCIISI